MFKKNPAAVVQLKNMTPSWNVGEQTTEFSCLLKVVRERKKIKISLYERYEDW